jgi:putative ABC transport system permease protein
MRLALVLALREMRGGLRGLRIVLACLALGVAAIAAVGSLRAGIDQGLSAEGSRILGGDLEVRGGSQPLPQALRDWLRARGARLSDVATMRSMLVAPNGQRQLIELKAVDPAYPLVGAVGLDPATSLDRALAGGGIVAEPLVLQRLGVKPGDRLRLGESTLTLRAALTGEPDRVATADVLGPRAIIALDTLPATGLVQPGSFVDYALRVKLPPGADPDAVTREIRAAFPGTGWRIRGPGEAAPGVQRFIDQTSLFMTLVGLTALLVGGIGVSTGVRAWLEARARSIATLRCLGASAGLIFATYLIQVLALACLGILAGLVAGAALPVLAARALGGVLPVPPRLGLYPGPLALASGYGLLTATCFALWPLGRAARIPGAALFRDAVLPQGVAARPRLLAANAAIAAALVALTVATSPDRGFALSFCAAAAATLALFRLGGALLVRGAGRLPRRDRLSFGLRLGVGDLHRPGSSAPLMLVSLGLGLTTLAAVALIEGNIRRQITEQMPRDAPSFYFIDIQNQQLPDFLKLVGAISGVSEVHQVPSLRARIVAVNGVPAEQVKATPETRWALRGDRGLTYSATPPEGTRLVAGSWWPPSYDGPPLVSFDAGLARGWGVSVGDTITVNVLGRDIPLKVASLRDIAWRSLAMNFALVASPGLLEHAPHMHIATLKAPPAEAGTVLRRVTDALPNVTGIDVDNVLAAVASLLEQLGAVLAATGGVTLAAGALVLAGAVAAGQRRRIQEAVVLKSLGATRAQIRAAWLVEFGAIGACAGLLAALVGTAASWAVMRFLMHAPWAFMPGVLAATVAGCVLLMLGFGYLGTAAALRAPAAPLLRNE